MPHRLSDMDLEWITDWIARGNTNQQIADACESSESAIRRFRRKHRLASPRTSSTRDYAAKADDGPSREELLDAEVRELRRHVRRNRRAEVAEERVLQAIESAFADTSYVSAFADMPTPADEPEGAHHSQAVLLSDWHAGEVVDPEQMNGINTFNFATLQDRVAEVRKALLSFKKSRPDLTELQLWFLGDMVSGNIHDELRETNEFPVAQQAVRTGHLIADLVSSLVPHFPRIRAIGIAGNHARTRKEHASKQVFDSMDVVAYELAAAMAPNSVKWEIPRSGFAVQEIAGQTFLLIHGDGIRSTMPGVPFGGVMRRWNELKKTYQDRGITLDGLVMGHLHQPNVISGNLFLNGSLIGSNEYGLKNYGSGAPPCQLLLTFDNNRRRLTDVSYITPSTGLPTK
jgi:hypothetical protein